MHATTHPRANPRARDDAHRRAGAPRASTSPVLALLAAAAFTLSAAPLAAASTAQPSPPLTPADNATPDPLARFENRLIRDVRIIGVDDADTRQLAENFILAKPGRPLRLETIRSDIAKLNRTGRFTSIDATVTPLEDQTVVLSYIVTPALVIRDVQAVGNRQVKDEDIARLVNIAKNTPADDFQLQQLANRIEQLYRDKGYFLAQVDVDLTELESDGIVLFRIREGNRMRVADIRFRGNTSFRTALIRDAAELKTRVSGLFEIGPVERASLEQDAAAITAFYRDRGFLDARADYERIESSDKSEAIIVFVIDEGPVYTVRSVAARIAAPNQGASDRPLEQFSDEQIATLIPVKQGSVASLRDIRLAADAIRDAYRKLGYVDAQVTNTAQIRDPDQPTIDLVFAVRPGERYLTGAIDVVGNDITQTKVALRNFRNLQPDRPFDATQLDLAEQRLRAQRLFEPTEIRLTIQPEDPDRPYYRDLLVELEETNTGSINFGVGINSDLGVSGIFGITQRNFDIADVPDSFGEFITGRAFRGAGQTFEIQLSPGTETHVYSVSFADPSILDSDYSFSTKAEYSIREFRDYDTDRIGNTFRFGRAFGERWQAAVSHRFENVNLSNIDDDAPTDVFDFEGDNLLHSVGLILVRTSADKYNRPTRGARTELGIEYFGLAGDTDFTRLTAEHQLYLPIYESYLGHTTVLSVKASAGYIPEGPDDVPVFERFYLGGQSLRGFRYRTVSPKGIRNDNGQPTRDPVGGSWSFFLGTEIVHPVIDETVALAFFIDSGTVLDDPGFDDYRVSAGVGIRLLVPQISNVPFAFDFGFPILKQSGDEERVFSFSFDIPFN